jgi:rod shape-determining protein MreC
MRFAPFLLFYRKPLFLLTIYVFLSLLMMKFNDPASLRPISNVSLQIVEVFANFSHNISLWKDYQEEARRLGEENARLKRANQKSLEVMLENIRLRKLLDLNESRQYDFISARVIGSGIELGVRSLILNVGERDSVRENMAVINGDGLVGKIISVLPDQSITQVLMDHNSLVSARLEISRESGVIGWDGRSWLNLQYISKDVAVSFGEFVVTSGLSQIYPPNLRIGFVSHIEQNDYDLFKKIRVTPSVDFKAIEEVMILKTTETGLAGNLTSE